MQGDIEIYQARIQELEQANRTLEKKLERVKAELVELESTNEKTQSLLHKAVEEAKEREKQLKLYKYALDSTADAVAIADMSGKQIYQNSTFSKLLDCPTNDDFDKCGGIPAFFVNNADFQKVIQQVTLRACAYEVELKSLTGRQFPALLRSGAVFDADDNAIAMMGVILDISERKQVEQTLRDYAEKLEETLKQLQSTQAQMLQAEKMSSLGQLVAGIAHEINNPVNFIHGNITYINEYTQQLLELIQLYQDEFLNQPQVIADKMEEIDLNFIRQDLPKLFSSMQVGTKRIREIIKSLRLFSRLDEADIKTINIHEGIDSTLMILQNRLKEKPKRIAIEVVKDYGDIPHIECYAGQLNQVFMNILVNAIDTLEEGIRNGQVKAPVITIRTSVINTWGVKITIADNGCGIPEEIKQRIFDPFFTTKPVGKGTGMGMSISYQIITDKHHGKLECFSVLGQGTEFCIQIPIQQIVDLT
ncbi:hypothetical protein NIES2101_05920 [Calothrix sp. HK-06]|nr:hypothetical protein NIES2101_05920 [Calothrix sp. HK-06]